MANRFGREFLFAYTLSRTVTPFHFLLRWLAYFRVHSL